MKTISLKKSIYIHFTHYYIPRDNNIPRDNSFLRQLIDKREMLHFGGQIGYDAI